MELSKVLTMLVAFCSNDMNLAEDVSCVFKSAKVIQQYVTLPK